MREAECGVSYILQKRGGDACMVTENMYLFFIYILFFYLIVITAVAVALFITLMVVISKLEKQKNTPLLGG